ncbi:MAG: Integral membrane protein MviN [Parcubacteria group bacterium GW2011_GWA1_51_12]|nr:MAG: Integral membrane protein MviN [Parcubacteria group bacterium GW2011_GWA1_51_12]
MVLRLLQKEIPSIHGAAFLIGAAGLLSRLLGVFRDRLLASQFGASRTLDVYYASFQIPDFVFTVFLVGAASAAIIPLFLKFSAEERGKAEKLIGGLLSVFSVGAVVIAGGVAVFASTLVTFIAPGFSPAEHELMTRMTRIMMISPVFLGFSNIIAAVMQARRQFLVFALTAIVYNIGIILGILFFVPIMGARGLAWGVVLGAALHLAIQIPVLWRVKFWPIFTSWSRIQGLSEVFMLSLPRVFALSLNQVMMLILVALGSLLAAGSIAIFQFSNNLRYLPIGIFGVSYAIAAFPKLTEAALKKSGKEFSGDLNAMVETILFWVVPLAFLTVVLRAHIVRLGLGAGYFSWGDTRLTAAALAILSIAMITEALSPLFIRAFYALGNTRLPFAVSLLTVLVVAGSAPFLLSLFTAHRLSGQWIADFLKVGDLPDVAVLGLVMALALGAVAQMAMLGFALNFEMKKFFGASVKNGMMVALLRTVFAAGLAAFVGYGTLYILSFWVSLTTFWGVFLQAAGAFLTSAICYAWIMYFGGSEEVRSVVEAFKRHAFSQSALPASIDDESRLQTK